MTSFLGLSGFCGKVLICCLQAMLNLDRAKILQRDKTMKITFALKDIKVVCAQDGIYLLVKYMPYESSGLLCRSILILCLSERNGCLERLHNAYIYLLMI